MSMDVYNHNLHCDQRWINAVENFVHLKINFKSCLNIGNALRKKYFMLETFFFSKKF